MITTLQLPSFNPVPLAFLQGFHAPPVLISTPALATYPFAPFDITVEVTVRQRAALS